MQILTFLALPTAEERHTQMFFLYAKIITDLSSKNVFI